MTNYIVSIKGYGDALIALWAINRLSNKQKKYRLLTTAYIAPLVIHLGKEDSVDILPNVINYPEIFDLRNSKLTDAARSIYLLRKELKLTCDLNDCFFIFDKNGLREFLIKPKNVAYKFIANVKEKNIYQGYLSTLNINGEISKANNQLNYESNQLHADIAIFFSSRVSAKQIKTKDLLYMDHYLRKNNLNPIYIKHAKDDFDDDLNKKINIRNYSSYTELDTILKNVDNVISSDSFPAHYAEYQGKRVYVVNNYLNEYYLPYSTFKNKWWSLGFSMEKLNKFFKKNC